MHAGKAIDLFYPYQCLLHVSFQHIQRVCESPEKMPEITPTPYSGEICRIFYTEKENSLKKASDPDLKNALLYCIFVQNGDF